MSDELNTRFCPMMALLSEGEDHCVGDGCMWFVKITETATGNRIHGCAVAFISTGTGNGYIVDVNTPEMEMKR